MHKPAVIMAILWATASSTAVAKDVPHLGTEAQEPATSGTLELIDQNQTIKTACETFGVETRPPNEGDNGQSTFLDCRTPVDANTPRLWDYANSKERWERVVLAVKPGKGLPYTIEMPKAAIMYVGIVDGSIVQINVAAANSRLTLLPRKQQ